MDRLKKLLSCIKRGQWILIVVAVVLGITAAVMGIADNLPGIILTYIALTCLAVAWVWNWRSPRDFWILLGLALLSFPVGVLLHNMLYALGTLVSSSFILAGLIGFFEVLFFLLAVIVVGPVVVVALAGGIYTSWRGIVGIVEVNRSYRRFDGKHQISEKQLRFLVNLARLSASLANLQPLKYITSFTDERNNKIFPSLSWAGYLKDWSGPTEEERPSAYIILLGDTALSKSFQYDAGIACQSILLGAADKGLGGCIIGSIKKETLREQLAIPDRYEIILVIALGKPREKVVIEDLESGGDIKYWRDDDGIHHVPKRGLEEIILHN